MNERIGVYSYNAILFSSKTKLTTDAHNTMDEAQNSVLSDRKQT